MRTNRPIDSLIPIRFLEKRGTNAGLFRIVIGLLATAFLLSRSNADQPQNGPTNSLAWLAHPLSLKECLQVGFQNNSALIQARHELEAAHGVSMQLRSIVLPQLKATVDATHYELNDVKVLPFAADFPENRWFGGIRLVQSLYEGGRLRSAVKTAALTKKQAILQYQTLSADAILGLRTAYFDLQLALSQVQVLESSVNLLEKQRQDIQHRLETGLVQRLDLLRADVELANARPKLIRARNDALTTKNKLLKLVGFQAPMALWDQAPLRLADPLQASPYDIELTSAILQALQNRSELEAQKTLVAIKQQHLIQARSGYKPSLQAYTGYGGLTDDLDRRLHGWFVGVQANWTFFDGHQTRGKINEAKALLQKAEAGWEDLTRTIELDVRTAYSSFTVAKEVLVSQKKGQEQGEEALRITTSRYQAGELAQLDVVAAQTALTEVRFNSIQALRDYNVALALLERAIGLPVQPEIGVK